MRQRTSLRIHALSAWCLSGALLAAACTGEVGVSGSGSSGSSPGPNGSGNGPGASTGGAGSTGTGGTSTGGTSTGGTGTGGTGSGTPPAAGPRDPGRVSMHRLNQAEYDNTVRDLLGTALKPGASFLNDAPELGFDNNSDQQTLSPAQAELYHQAAETLAAEMLLPANRSRFVTCDLAAAGEACSRTVLTGFGARAFRRPLATEEVTSYLALMAKARTVGATADEALRTAFEAMLVSPHFLFRPELDPDPASASVHPVGPYEMASRLSYLVYRSMPDQPLFDAAAANKLSNPAEIRAHTERMLVDPKGGSFARTFVDQWLGTRIVAAAQFDTDIFPKFTPALAASLKSEVNMFFEEFVRENLPARELVTANFTYLDNTLAAFYGLPAPGTGFKRTVLTTTQRGGLLTMGGALAVTSYPTRGSIVKRGAWVLGQLLCSEPPPPPPDVGSFPDAPPTTTSQRQILAMHRTVASCAACHESMDNIGLALENYDAIGGWRTSDPAGTIDPRGTLQSGETFNGARELGAVIAQDARFEPCVAENLLAYALGRTLDEHDEPYIHDIAKGSGGAVRMRDMLLSTVSSDTFRLRHGEPVSAMGAQP